ncbi:interferon regulatory factor 1 isoform X3 [Otolemur garnettii]|nr:interferon regulatory factor 1 isoform X3 [Otolemur garnettii]
MNSLPDIEEVKDQSRNKGSSAVRVYRMLPPLTKNQRKERKSKSSRDAKSKAKRKSYGDSSPDTFSDGLSSSTLPDDHSSYTAQGYLGQDLEVERALTPALSPCAVSSTLPDWRIPLEVLPDSTSDHLYSFQVSPMPSASEAATDEDEEGKLPDDIMKLLEQSEWQPTSVDGKGYLLNEPGAQPTSVYGDFSCKEEPEVDSPGGDTGLNLQRVFTDLKNMDTSWLDSLLTPVRLPSSIQAIPCAP